MINFHESMENGKSYFDVRNGFIPGCIDAYDLYLLSGFHKIHAISEQDALLRPRNPSWKNFVGRLLDVYFLIVPVKGSQTIYREGACGLATSAGSEHGGQVGSLTPAIPIGAVEEGVDKDWALFLSATYAAEECFFHLVKRFASDCHNSFDYDKR